jgi:DNA-binding protein HU-beta
MNKKELIDAISKQSKLTKVASEAALNSVIDCLTDALAKGDSIIIPRFASLTVKKRAARMGRNPATGKPISISARKTVNFKMGSKLREAINGRAF